ncbi:ABC transporter substrate-binding protein [Chitinasiproducens palmae]|uniref:Amino acid/amide ABC transporter substrate-binding protein, HAAT family n=1 Tax=Chitinasiproducens palmae TaxID=1770053 RepID=A0A1H2PKY5_9BURK|nr:ABC transporter substrate-binding protein [Chitinasiproducens palmae]SDV47022.1 amino acid/amide ABC transporter substrate-binding protein, HAAT family [Chitinasiproducens palmae]
MPRHTLRSLTAALLGAVAFTAHAQVKVGVDLSTTGPAATIGISSKNAFLMWPKTLGGQPAEYIFLDDATDPGNAVRNIRRLLSEDKVDVIVGPTITPTALAALDVIAEAKTPMLALVGAGSVVEPQTGSRTWAFKMASSDSAFADVTTRYMAAHNVKTLAYIGFADGYGENWLKELRKFAEQRKIKLVAVERYNRTDTSVTGQVLKLLAAKPDAILIAGAGTPTVLPQRTIVNYGYKGQIYQTAGIGTPDFIKLGGKDVEGTLFPTQPVLVATSLPADNPVRKTALDFVTAYEQRYGAGTANQFSGDAAGVYPRLNDAVARALKTAQPGTPAFRQALRDALESTKDLVIPQGIVNTSPTDHIGLDQRSVVMGTVRNGKFQYVSQ